jgi:hypothetical protein
MNNYCKQTIFIFIFCCFVGASFQLINVLLFLQQLNVEAKVFHVNFFKIYECTLTLTGDFFSVEDLCLCSV